MHKNEFEKQVQKKMEELRFVPSDSVWQNVDKGINKKEKRRTPVMWMWFFCGLLLLGSGYYYVASKKNSSIAANLTAQKSGSTKLPKEQHISEDHKLQMQNKKKVEHELNDEAKNDRSKIFHFESELKKKPTSYKKGRGFAKAGNSAIEIYAPNNLTHTENAPELGAVTEKENNNEKGNSRSISNKKENQIFDNKYIADSTSKKISTEVTDRAILHEDSSQKKIVQDNLSKEKSSSWKIGYTASIGISGISESFLKSAYMANPAYSSTATTPGRGSYEGSKINSDISFIAGVIVNKRLTQRIYISAGLNYHYYSTKIYTGSKGDSSIYLYPNSLLLLQANSYYKNGNTHAYTNQYHFIEFPASVNFQLNKNPALPLIWEAGFSLSYLAGTNALHFEPFSGVYYKNNGQFNKIQFGVATALMMGFHFYKSDLRFGPQFQYGLTGVVNNQATTPEHLFFVGIKSIFSLQKK